MPHYPNDIRLEKKELRETSKGIRSAFSAAQKAQFNEKITRRVQELWSFRDAPLLYAYVSSDIEVNTHSIIRTALAKGKTVAVPRCVPGTRQMEFYAIESLEELSAGAYGILEPTPDPAKQVLDTETGLCIVPGLAFDMRGYRLGFGKGYYDRFLANYHGAVIGLCFDDCIVPRLPNGKYDKPIKLIVTEKRILRTDPTA